MGEAVDCGHEDADEQAPDTPGHNTHAKCLPVMEALWLHRDNLSDVAACMIRGVSYEEQDTALQIQLDMPPDAEPCCITPCPSSRGPLSGAPKLGRPVSSAGVCKSVRRTVSARRWSLVF
jgi:hypothetical protein